jgi:hypothetical protein
VLSGGVPLGLLGMRLSGVVQYASGTPYNVTTGADDNLDGITSDRPTGLSRNSGEETPADAVTSLRDAEQLAPAAIPAEPVLFQVDLRVAWPFAFEGARSTSEFYLQVFNLLNRFNAGAIEGRATSATFGEPTAYAGPPRTIEVGVRLGF